MLERLTIESLRGATRIFELPFKKDKKITLVFGENGSGKSTICDAFELIGTGVITSLEGRGIGTTARYWPSSGKQAKDVRVVLKGKKGQWTARLGKNGALVDPATGLPRVQVLRRSQILNLVTNTPANRYEAIRPFIDISAIEAAEQAITDLINADQKGRDEAAARVDENKRVIDAAWLRNKSPKPDSLTWARATVKKGLKELNDELVWLKKIHDALLRVESGKEALDQRGANAAKKKEALEAAETVQKKEADQATTGSVELITLLQSAQHLFQDHPEQDSCPLCLSKENISGLSQKVDQRIGAIQALQAAMTAMKKARDEYINALELQKQARLELVKQVAKIMAALIVDRVWPEDVKPTAQLTAAAQEFPKAPSETEPSDKELDASLMLLSAYHMTVQDAISEREQRKGAFDQLKEAVDAYDLNSTTLQRCEQILPKAKLIKSIIEKERKTFVDGILGRIATRVGVLFEKIHPAEGLEKISLKLNPAAHKKNSLDLVSNWDGTEVPPQAYFSDSHLDTLGLCIFLALAELEDPSNTIIVLDDLLGSVDEPHTDRVIKMLYEEAELFGHMVITTHYKPWAELIRWRKLQRADLEVVELSSWSLGEGMNHEDSLPPFEELRLLLGESKPKVQDICAKGGVILEALLDFVTWQYECAVPRKKGKPTLSDFMSGLSSKLRNALRVEVQRVDTATGEITYESINVGPILLQLDEINGARNIFGCHYNEIAAQMNEKFAVEFGTLVLKLSDLIVDPLHGWPLSDKSGSYWATRNETRKLHPLKRPS